MKKLLLILVLLIPLFSISQIQQHGMLYGTFSGNGLLPDLIALYPFDESSGNATDVINSYTGTNSNITYERPTVTNLDVSYGFNGTTSVSTVADNDDFSFTDGAGNDLPFSISFWIDPDNVVTNRSIVSKYDGGDFEYFLIIRGTSSKILLRFYSELSGTSTIGRESNTVVSTGSFQHYLVTYDGSENPSGINIYRNGSLDNGSTESVGSYVGMDNGTEPFLIGLWNTNYYDGDLDQPAIWKDRELSSDDALALYSSGDGLPYTDFTARIEMLYRKLYEFKYNITPPLRIAS